MKGNNSNVGIKVCVSFNGVETYCLGQCHKFYLSFMILMPSYIYLINIIYNLVTQTMITINITVFFTLVKAYFLHKN